MTVFSIRVVARRLAAAVVVASAVSATPVSAQMFDFEGQGYGGAAAPCNWDGGSVNMMLDGFQFWGLRPLDLANYQRCWSESSTPGQQNGYAKTGVVALGFGDTFVQRGPATEQFYLNSLQLGAGWTNPTTITLVGMRWGDEVMYSSAHALNPASGPLTVTGAPDIAIDYFRLLVNWNLPLAGDWTTGDGPSSWDPYDSRERRYEAGARDGQPYLTYYVDNVNVAVVPEPSSYALLAVGLAVAGMAARRRQARAR